MKRLISFFIKHPVSVNILILGIAVFGYMGVKQMSSSFFPLTTTKTVVIEINYLGASPAEIEEGIVIKIEDNLRGINGLDRVTSKSFENRAIVTVEALKGFDINVFLAEVKNAVDRVATFPGDMEPPIISKREVQRQTISFSLSGDKMSLKTLKDFARNIETDILAIEGISQLSLSGFPDEEIEIAVKENVLRAYGLTFNEVATAVRNTNLLSTGGRIKTDQEELLIRAKNKKYYASELDNIVVRSQANGNIIRLKDIATIRDKWSESPDRLFTNENTAINFNITNTNSEDMILAADNVLAYITEFNQKQENVQLLVLNNMSIILKERTKLLLNNGFVGVVLVLIFLSLFLRPRLAFWVAFGMPIAFLGMFIFASSLGVTINVLSLFGMIIVIGILVDDGIVISENIYNHYENGKTPIRAAIDGTMEVVPPIISAVLTTIIAFSTFFFLQGRIGEFFGEVATVVTLTLLISLLEAFIILPAHIAHSKALSRDVKPNIINKYADKAMTWMRDTLYLPILKILIQNKLLSFAIPIALLMLTVGGLSGGHIKTTFFPAISSDIVNINLAMPQGTNEAITDSLISMIEEKAMIVSEELSQKQTGKKKVIEFFSKRVGPGTANASLVLNLLPGDQRDLSALEVANVIKEKVGKVHGVESLSFGSNSIIGGKPISISLIGNNIEELKKAKQELKQELTNNKKLKDVIDTDPGGIKELKIELKDNAYLLGFTLNSVMAQVRGAFFGAQAQRFQRGRDDIRVYVRYDLTERKSLQNLDEMRLLTNTGERVAFHEIANYSIARGEVAINHKDGKREINLSANMVNIKDSANNILDDMKAGFIANLLDKYPSVSTDFEGQNREASKIQRSAKLVLPLVILMIYIVIGFTFKSYSQPILLLIMVPFSLIGVGWGHYIHDFPVNILSWLGIIALVGIMVNDGLVLIQKFNLNLRDGMLFNDALFEAGRSRFRAIFLTTITTVAGLAPLILETSRQAQFLIPMAISIAYGIIIATFLTLLTLPTLLSVNNFVKRVLFSAGHFFAHWKWLWPSKEEVENAVVELKNHSDDLEF